MKEIKNALCIKNGFMLFGQQFCIKNKLYEYFYSSNVSHEYTVKTEGMNCHNHSMADIFFDEYFSKIEINLEDELFEI